VHRKQCGGANQDNARSKSVKPIKKSRFDHPILGFICFILVQLQLLNDLRPLIGASLI
jgi:hypothetical protein